MSSNKTAWETVPLTDVLAFREGPGILARDFRDKGVPLLRLAGLKRNASLLDGCNYLDEDMVEQRWRQFRVEPGDVLLSTSASLGEVAVVDESARGAIPYTGIIAFRPKSDRIHPRFIQFALTAPSFKRQIEAMGVGSVMRHFGPSHLRRMTVELPPIAQQVAIADVLGALDDKIAVNERIASTAESLSITLASEDLWNVRIPLGDLAEHVKEQVAPTSIEAARVAHYSLPAFDQGRLPEITDPGEIKSAKFRVSAAAVLLSKLNPGTPRVWNVEPDPGLPALASTEFLVLRPKFGIHPSELWAVCNQAGFRDDVANKATGTSNSHQRARPADILASHVVDPRSMRTSSREQIVSLCARAKLARIESQKLADLRDALLPGLMLGAIQVRDAEKAVEEAT